MALTKVTGQVIKNTTDVTVGVLTVTNTLAVGGTVSIGGTLTYEDVTNIDSVGLITARNGIVVGSGITLSKDGDGFFTGVITATSYSGIDLSNVTGAQGDFTIADKIIHSGDTNTAIRFPADNQFTVETGGSQRMSLSSSGIIFNETGEDVDFRIEGDSEANLVLVNAAEDTVFMGGLTTPSSEGTGVLVVDGGNSNIGGIQIHAGGGQAAGDLSGISFSHGNSGTSARPKAAIALESSHVGYGLGHLCFYVDSTGDNNKVSIADEKLRISSSGLVGIGTSTPAAQLHITSGASGDCELILESDPDDNNETDNPRIIFRQDGGSDQTSVGCDNNELVLANSVSGGNGGILFKTGTTSPYTNATDKVKITTAGNVLIGTTTETDNLVYIVKDHTEAFVNPNDSIIRIENSNTSGTTGQASISFTVKTSGSNADSAIVSQAEASGDSRLEFWTDTNNGMTEKMSINHDGHVLKPSNVSFCIYSPGPQTFSNGMVINTNSANTSQPWHNVGSHWSVGNDEFTAPITGRYMMTLSLTFWFESDHSSDGWDITVERDTGSGYNNVAEYYFGGGQASGYEDRCNVEGIWHLNAGDKIRYTAGGYAGSGTFQQKVFTGYLMG